MAGVAFFEAGCTTPVTTEVRVLFEGVFKAGVTEEGGIGRGGDECHDERGAALIVQAKNQI